MHGKSIDQTPKAFYYVPDGEMAIIIANALQEVPFWFRHNAALFNRNTPETVRTELFNAVLDANDNTYPPGTVYATSVKLVKGTHHDSYLAIALTLQGVSFLKEHSGMRNIEVITISRMLREERLKDRLEADAVNALKDFGFV